jgi:hypothetical protein
MRCLAKISNLIGGAIAKAINVLGGFFKGFGKVVGSIPGLGWLIKPIFDKIGSVLTSFSNKMFNFTQNYSLLSKKVAQESIENLDVLAKNAKREGTVFKFSEDGTVLFAFNKEGKQIAKLPSKFVEDTKLFNIHYGEGASRVLFDPARGPLAKQVNQYYKSVAKIGARSSTFSEKVSALFTKHFPVATGHFFKALPFFIGKQVYKLIFGKDWTGGDGQWSKEEISGHGNAALNSWINDRLAKETAASGAVYKPDIILDSSDEEVVDHITDYQNHFAKLHDQPTIVEAIKKQSIADDTKNQFEDFWKGVESGEIKRGESDDQIDHTVADDLSTEFGGKSSTTYITKEKSRPKFESRSIFSFSEFKNK